MCMGFMIPNDTPFRECYAPPSTFSHQRECKGGHRGARRRTALRWRARSTEGTATKTNGKLFAVILALALGAVSLSGCGGLGQNRALVLANIGWDENVAVSYLTKAVLEEDLGYEKVAINTSDKLGATYRGVASGELDAFQDVWLPNQEELLNGVAGDVEHLGPWYLGETKQGMAVPAYMEVRSIDQLNGTDTQLIYGIEDSSVIMHRVGGHVIPAYGLKQLLVTAPTAGMLDEVGSLYATREDFVFLAWSPHWMNQRYDIRYLKDPKDALGPTNDPAECSTIVSGDLREDDPVAYAFMDALELTQGQIEGLETAINEEGNSLAGARRWVSDNREIVRPWIEAARDAR
jgi:glycine betaine/proline transport system substrate-binding protein